MFSLRGELLQGYEPDFFFISTEKEKIMEMGHQLKAVLVKHNLSRESGVLLALDHCKKGTWFPMVNLLEVDCCIC